MLKGTGAGVVVFEINGSAVEGSGEGSNSASPITFCRAFSVSLFEHHSLSTLHFTSTESYARPATQGILCEVFDAG